MAKQIVGKYFKTSLTFINEVYNKEQKVLWNQKSDSERKFDWLFSVWSSLNQEIQT